MPLTLCPPPLPHPPLRPGCLSCCSATRLLPFLAGSAHWPRPLTAVQDQLHRLDESEEESQTGCQPKTGFPNHWPVGSRLVPVKNFFSTALNKQLRLCESECA